MTLLGYEFLVRPQRYVATAFSTEDRSFIQR